MSDNPKNPTKRKKAVGRPKKYDIDEKEVVKLASYGMTNIQIADFFGCSKQLITTNYCTFIAKGKLETISNLRQKQIEVALKGNVSMLIWLGKQWLGQSEKAEVQMNRPIEEVEYLEI